MSANASDKAIGQRISVIRKSLGLSQENLGNRIGVSFQQIQKYEIGANRISASQLLNFSHALDVSIQDLLPDDESSGPVLLSEMDADTVKLVRLFSRIQDKATRKTILNIVSSFGDRLPGKR